MGSRRPPVSVVVPFRGGRDEALRMAAGLERLRQRPGDEVILADNTDDGILASLASADWLRVVAATAERSSYSARNAGARVAANEWILFTDADCVPAPDLLDAYFATPITKDCAIVGGEIAPDATQRAFLARYARSRNYLSQTEGLHGKAGSAVATANALVRRSAFDAAGGFVEGIRSGGDVDLCWRLIAMGWSLEYQPSAVVVHRHRERLVPFLGQIARYAAGARWLDRRHPGSYSRWPLGPGLAGSARDIGGHLLRGRLEPALFRAVDGVGLIAHNVGYLASNRAPRR